MTPSAQRRGPQGDRATDLSFRAPADSSFAKEAVADIEAVLRRIAAAEGTRRSLALGLPADPGATTGLVARTQASLRGGHREVGVDREAEHGLVARMRSGTSGRWGRRAGASKLIAAAWPDGRTNEICILNLVRAIRTEVSTQKWRLWLGSE